MELDDLSLLAGHHRWLTISRAGGQRQDHLASTFAVRHVESGGTACFIDLTQTRNPDSILAAVLDACGVIARDERVGLRRLRKALASTPMLLVCDNGEHVSGTLGGLLDDLLDAPQLSVLVTSRTPLRGDGEHVG